MKVVKLSVDLQKCDDLVLALVLIGKKVWIERMRQQIEFYGSEPGFVCFEVDDSEIIDEDIDEEE